MSPETIKLMSERVYRLVYKKLEWEPGNSKEGTGVEASNSTELKTYVIHNQIRMSSAFV